MFIGLENNNSVAKRRYFSASNKWDAAYDMLKIEHRVTVLGSLKRTKRKYDKIDQHYWESGIREDRNKRLRLGQ